MDRLKNYLKERFSDRAFLVLTVIYAAFCLFSTVWWSINFNRMSYILMSALFILFVPAILIAERLIGMRCRAIFVFLVYFVASGAVLGSPFNFYAMIPFFDTILHGTSGVLFAALGFTIAERFFGKGGSLGAFVGKLVMAVSFSLAIAVLWEIWELGCTLILGMETMDDTLVDGFKTFFFGGRHGVVIFEGITETVINYGNGESYVIEGGYLDIGLFDTLADMIICTVGALLFAILAVIGRAKLPILNQLMIPEAVGGKEVSSTSADRDSADDESKGIAQDSAE